MSGPTGHGPDPFTPAHAPGEATLFQCPLCGGRFTHGEKVCGSCPLSGGCELVECPHCGYRYPRESRVASWLVRTVGRILRRA